MNKSIVDNHHTTQHLQDRSKRLPTLAVSCDSDITKFHLKFNEIKGLLTGHGIGDLNFMKYLWHLYKVCKDFEFRMYMKSNKVDSDDIQTVL